MGTITTKDGTEIFYKDWGPKNAQPIVFHHGWPLSADDWDNQMLFFLHRVIASSRMTAAAMVAPSQGDSGHDMDHYAADASAVFEHLDLKNSVHIGHSTGGGAGRPLRREIRRAAGPRRQGGADRARFRRSWSSRTRIRAACRSRSSTACARRSPTIARSSTSICRPARSTATTGPARRSDQGVIYNWWRQGMMGGAKAHYDGIKAFSETDQTEDLKAISVPTLVMHGDDDQIVPYADSAPLSSKLLKNGIAQDLSRLPARHADHACRGHQRRPARLHQELSHPAIPARTSGDAAGGVCDAGVEDVPADLQRRLGVRRFTSTQLGLAMLVAW